MLKQAAYTAAQSVAGIFTKSLQLGEKTVEVANTTANFVNSTVGLADKTVGVAGKSTDVINEAQDTAIDQLKNVSDLTKSATKFSTKTIETLTEQLNGVSATSQEGLKLVTAAGAILSGALIENKPEFSKLIAFPVKIASGVSNTISTLVRLILIIPFDSFEKTIDRLRLAREKRLATIQTQTDKQNEIAVLKLELEKLELLRKLNEAANAKQSTLDKIVENPTEKIGDGLNAVRADTTVVGKIITDETPSLKNSITQREAIENPNGPSSSPDVVVPADVEIQAKSPYSPGQEIEYKLDNGQWVKATYNSVNDDGTLEITYNGAEVHAVNADNTRNLPVQVKAQFRGGRRRKTKMRNRHDKRNGKKNATRKCCKTIFDIKW